MREEETIGALILAAGQSRRMGAFKPLLPLRGQTVIENTVMSALTGGCASVTVVTGCRAAEVEAVLYRRFGGSVRCVRNPAYAATDMLRSAQIGVKALTACGAFFLLPGDMPAVTGDTFARLRQARGDDRPAVVFPTLEGYRKHPPLIDARLIPDILAFDGEGGLRALWQRYEGQIRSVPVDDAGVWVDLDTPEDYEKCRDRYEDKEG